MDQTLKSIFGEVERYTASLLDAKYAGSFSKEENKVLALQNINRFNIHLGRVARKSKENSGSIHLLQMYVNNITIALKNDNIPLLKSAIASTRSIICEFESEST